FPGWPEALSVSGLPRRFGHEKSVSREHRRAARTSARERDPPVAGLRAIQPHPTRARRAGAFAAGSQQQGDRESDERQPQHGEGLSASDHAQDGGDVPRGDRGEADDDRPVTANTFGRTLLGNRRDRLSLPRFPSEHSPFRRRGAGLLRLTHEEGLSYHR